MLIHSIVWDIMSYVLRARSSKCQVSYDLELDTYNRINDKLISLQRPMTRVLYSLGQWNFVEPHTKMKLSHFFPTMILLYNWMWQYILKELIYLTLGFFLLGIILAVVFIRMKTDKGKDNVESAQASEVKPLRSWIWKGMFEFIQQVLFQ